MPEAPTGNEAVGRLDLFFDRLFVRSRRNYGQVLLAINTAWILLVVVPGYSVGASTFFEFSFADALLLIALCEVGQLVALPGLLVLVHRRHRAGLQWLRGEPDADPVAAWSTTVIGLPGTVVQGVVWLAACNIPGLLYLSARLDFSVPATLAWLATTVVFVSGAGLFDYLMFERALRPAIRREFFAALPPDFRPMGRGLPLRAKLLAVLLLLSMFSAIFVAALTTRSTDALSQAGVAWTTLGATLAFTVTLGLPLSLLVRESVLTRVETLQTAMGRVDRGEYDAQVMPLGADELDELGRSFNQMVGRLRDHDEELRESRARIVAASDAARRQVERDLHDGAQQQLVTLRLRIGMALKAVESDPKRATALLHEASDDLSRALDELRDLAHGIYPAVLTTEGLPGALEAAAERCLLPVSVDGDGVDARFPAEVEAAIYFCCVEALQNAAKHAGPGARVQIRLIHHADALRFEVRDDGVGYDPAALGISAGLQNMADRIGALGGTLRVESSPGKGTAVVGTMAGAV